MGPKQTLAKVPRQCLGPKQASGYCHNDSKINIYISQIDVDFDYRYGLSQGPPAGFSWLLP